MEILLNCLLCTDYIFTRYIDLTGNSIELYKQLSFMIQACDGIELLDLLFDKNDGILCHENMHQNDQPWPMQDPNVSDRCI